MFLLFMELSRRIGTAGLLLLASLGCALAATYRPASTSALVSAAGKALPGDVIYLAAGATYVLPRTGSNCGLNLARSGTATAPITLATEGTTRAILDASQVRDSTGWSNYGLCVSGAYWRVNKLVVKGAVQTRVDASNVGEAFGAFVSGPHNRLTNIRSRNNQGVGIFWQGSDGYLGDCESDHNYDPITRGNADGISVARLAQGLPGVLVERCRSHDNSDDGFDLWESEAPVTIVGSQATRNGYQPGTLTRAGDGDGYKLGRNDSGPRHVLDHVTGTDNAQLCVDFNGGSGPVELRYVTCSGNKGWDGDGTQIELGPYANVVIP